MNEPRVDYYLQFENIPKTEYDVTLADGRSETVMAQMQWFSHGALCFGMYDDRSLPIGQARIARAYSPCAYVSVSQGRVPASEAS